MKKIRIFALILILVSFAISVYSYSDLPEKVASHWNINGEVDGYMPKFQGIFLIPVLSIIIYVLMLTLPKIDPLKGIKKFRKYYEFILLLIISFMVYIQILIILWNLGYSFNFIIGITPAFSLLFILIGFRLRYTKQNWFMGIRTPWTLSSKKVWKKTHVLGSKLFIVSGILSFFGIFFKKYAFFLLIAPVIISTFIVFVYSYIIYKGLKKK
ncbi:DUF1648 domain-containing protein [Candidatus Woesearchaeota archaeon]|nr:DUF1648 domain-containing protein [Candidatus Woesearchaeota archaeon]